MSKIKLCGLSRKCDIEWANELHPEYIGFVFAPKSRRYVSVDTAAELKAMLSEDIKAVGVFVNSPIESVAYILSRGIIDIAQLHGSEDEEYISQLSKLTDKPIIKAFSINSAADVSTANNSSADMVLLDSGQGGTGTNFDWKLLGNINRPYFLAGGLCCENISQAITALDPYAVDVSSGIETNGCKDKNKMAAFVAAVRKEI
ncbi:MAG: phosphoribosylanthranilate isomerase [Ruminiclostridium sp.]